MMGLVIDGDRQLKGSYQHEKEAKNEARKSAHSAPGPPGGSLCHQRIGRIRCFVHHAPKSDTALISCTVLRHTPKRERGEQLSPLAPLSPADHSEGVVFWMSMRNSALD